MIRALIIDDEKDARQALHTLLTKYCPDVQIIGEAGNAEQAMKLIDEQKPELIFLDIEMPRINGISFLQQLPKPVNFEVVFVTAYNQYAIKAIELAALHYLLKPIDKNLLVEAVNRFKEKKSVSLYQERLELFISTMINPNKVQDKISISTSKGFEMIKTSEIIYLEAFDNYTDIFLLGQSPKKTVSKTLKTFEDILDKDVFFRCSRKHIVNVNFIKEYLHQDGGVLLLEPTKEISVSDSYKKSVLERLTKK